MGQGAVLETEKGNSEKTGVKQHASNSCENRSLLLGNLLQLFETGIGLLKEEPWITTICHSNRVYTIFI